MSSCYYVSDEFVSIKIKAFTTLALGPSEREEGTPPLSLRDFDKFSDLLRCAPHNLELPQYIHIFLNKLGLEFLKFLTFFRLVIG